MPDSVFDTRVQECLIFEILHYFSNIGWSNTLG